jgi:Zn-dependent peptidase ImmA (M78 family)
MAYLDKRVIRSRARDVLKEHGMLALPVPIDRLAKGMGISVRYEPLDGELSGMAFVKGGVRVVAVNSFHHSNRQRFTIAHEIGHHVLHAEKLLEGIHVDKAVMRRDVLSATGTDDFEIQANVFGSELLMPRESIVALAGQLDLDDEEQLARCAKKIKVSVAALQFRLSALDE